METASGLFNPSILRVRRGFVASASVYRSGFWLSNCVSKKIVCANAAQGAEKLSNSESRPPRLVSKGCKLLGCGSAVPGFQIANDDLSKIVETSDEWISVRTGIRNRRILSGKDSLTALAVEAAKKALEMAKVAPDDVDLVLLCTSTPEDLFGSAPQIQKALGCKNNPLAYDITAACSGFVLGLVSAACYIRG